MNPSACTKARTKRTKKHWELRQECSATEETLLFALAESCLCYSRIAMQLLTRRSASIALAFLNRFLVFEVSKQFKTYLKLMGAALLFLQT